MVACPHRHHARTAQCLDFLHAGFVNASTKVLSHLMDWEESVVPQNASGDPLGVLTRRDFRVVSIIVANLLLLAVLYFFFTIGLFRLWRERKIALLLVLLASVFYFIAVIGPAPNSRYRLSFIPFILYGAGVGLDKLEFRIQKST